MHIEMEFGDELVIAHRDISIKVHMLEASVEEGKILEPALHIEVSNEFLIENEFGQINTDTPELLITVLRKPKD